jgi:hypothetical protein
MLTVWGDARLYGTRSNLVLQVLAQPPGTAIIDTIYAVTARKQFIACGSEVLSRYAYVVFRPAGRKTTYRRTKRTALPKAQHANCASPVIDRTYAVTTRTGSIACGSEVPFYFTRVFFAPPGEKDAPKKEKYNSAEG